MENDRITGWHRFILVVTRIAIGWHLFYQGFGKLIDVKWTAEGYLKAGWGPFVWLAENPTLLAISDTLTIWGLMIVGLFLMIGLFTRLSCLAGSLLLFSIYVAVPPIDWAGFVISTDRGSELWVNQTLIEVLALIIPASFRTGHIIGLDIMVRHYWRNR